MVGPNLAHSRISLYRIFFVPDDTQTCFPPAAINPCPPAAAAPHLLRRITTVCPGRMECLHPAHHHGHQEDRAITARPTWVRPTHGGKDRRRDCGCHTLPQ